jgi:hypothetical protein
MQILRNRFGSLPFSFTDVVKTKKHGLSHKVNIIQSNMSKCSVLNSDWWTDERPEFRTKQEMGKKKRYDGEELQDAVTMHKNGVKMSHILTKYPHIPRRTIYDYINHKKNGLEV